MKSEIDNQDLRGIIIKLQDYLTDEDRRRLHFFLGNDVPRRIRDEPTLSGTLSLMESLFDQDKINEQDFTFLIHAFEQIRCIDAVKLLREHMRRMQSDNVHQHEQNLATIMSCTKDQFNRDDDQEDRIALPNIFIDERCNSARFDGRITQGKAYENRTMSNSIEGGINQEVITNQTVVEETNRSKNPPTLKRILIILIVIIALLVMALIGLIIGIMKVKFEWKEKIENCLEEKMRNNNTIEYLKTMQRIDNTTMEKLTKKTNDLQAKLQTTIGTTCGCAQWCKNHDDSPYGVCGDGHTCICRHEPITKDNVGSGCTCEAWCRKYGYQNGGICGDGYTCICSI